MLKVLNDTRKCTKKITSDKHKIALWEKKKKKKVEKFVINLLKKFKIKVDFAKKSLKLQKKKKKLVKIQKKI